jgi:hypothetical protein
MRDKIYFVDTPDDSLWFGSLQEAKDEFVFNHIEVSHTEKVEIEWTSEDTATFVTSVGEYRLRTMGIVG